MKTFLYVMLIFSSFAACRDNKDQELEDKIPQELIGKWEAFEVYSTDGGSMPTWTPLPSQFTFYFNFFSDYKVITSFHGEGCNIGKYSINDNIISFTFPCIDHTIKIDSLSNEILILDTQNFEPLKYKLQKVTE